MTTHQVVSPAEQEQFDEFAFARRAQGDDVRRPCCRDCKHLVSEKKLVPGNRPWNRYEATEVHVNPRCDLGGFAVVLTACCQRFERLGTQSTTTE